MDATRQRILPGAPHTREDRKAAYRAMHFAAELLLDAGAGVVLDAPYGHREDREDLARIAGRAFLPAAGFQPACGMRVPARKPPEGASSQDCPPRIGRMKLIECVVSPEIAVRRLLARGPDPERPDLTPERVERLVREYA